MTALQLLVLVAYASLAYECFIMRVPSVASTYELVQQDEERSSVQKVLLLVLPTVLSVAAFLLPLVLALAPDLRAFLIPLEMPGWLTSIYVCAALLVCGRVLTLSAVSRLRRAVREAQVLRDGPFRLSRNPALLGLHIFFAGNCLAFPCVVLFAGFALWCVHMHGRVRIEESFLSARFGDEYNAYRRSVRRYL